MRVSREQAAENRRRIVKTAGKLFREKGYDGIGVADLMKAAGLTHGGFYGHFRSKDDLVAEAVSETLAASAERWKKRVADRPDEPMAALVDYYLSNDHRDAAGIGCAVPALAGETSRQAQPVRDAYGRGVEGLVQVLAETMPEKTPEERRQSALVAFSAMVGAVAMSRAVGDNAFADEILGAVRVAFARSS